MFILFYYYILCTHKYAECVIREGELIYQGRSTTLGSGRAKKLKWRPELVSIQFI